MSRRDTLTGFETVCDFDLSADGVAEADDPFLDVIAADDIEPARPRSGLDGLPGNEHTRVTA